MTITKSGVGNTLRKTLGILIYFCAFALAVKFSTLLIGYFTDDYKHPITFVTDMLGLKPTFKNLSELSFFDNPFMIVMGFVSIFSIYISLCVFTFKFANYLYLNLTMSKTDLANYKEKLRAKADKVLELGTLLSVNVGTSATTIETEQGFFFIQGIPDALKKGAAVGQIDNHIVFDHGQGNSKRYSLATKNEVT